MRDGLPAGEIVAFLVTAASYQGTVEHVGALATQTTSPYLEVFLCDGECHVQ